MGFSRKYRLYVDEVGNSDLGASTHPNHRYLSLTGVAIALDHVETYLHPRIESLKRRYFNAHPDDPVILHRKEIVRAKPPFHALSDVSLRSRFDTEMFGVISETEFQTITVVIDKLEHTQRYAVWRADPYHYCLTALVERFARWLERNESVGDVLAESRGGKSDIRLKKSFENLVENGSEYQSSELFRRVLTSRQLKVKPKALNIAGLQVADLIAHPSFRSMKHEREGTAEPAEDFGARIVAVLKASKYQRSPDGRIDGWGRKWLP